MNERCRLKGLARLLTNHLAASEPAELLIDERKKFFLGAGVAVPKRFEEASDIAHEGSLRAMQPAAKQNFGPC
jgi:hypothetical protein